MLWLCKQDQIDAAVQQLLTLKAEYKQLTGQEYKVGTAPAPKTTVPGQSSSAPAPAAADLYEKVAAQGDLVRRLKAEKAPKVSRWQETSTWFVLQEVIVGPYQDQVDQAIKTLLDLKNNYKSITGEEYKPVAAAGATGGEDKNRKDRENKSEKQGGGGGEGKKGKGDKGSQAKESSGGAGGAGDGQGAKKQTRWDRKWTKREGQSRPAMISISMEITVSGTTDIFRLRDNILFYFLHLESHLNSNLSNQFG